MLPFWLLRSMKYTWCAIVLCLANAAMAQIPSEAARQYVNAHKAEILEQFSGFLAIPNVAADPEGLRRNADLLISELKKRGVDAQLLAAAGSPSVVYGKVDVPGAKRTIVFYAHYDGQPVTPSEWTVTAPFKPLVKSLNGEPRIWARGAGDDKAAIFAQLAAFDALRSARIPLRANIRFVWDGEEEAGSPHLEKILNAHRELITGDVWLICDGPSDQSGKQSVAFGARGDSHLEITVYGPNHGLHSGHYGNWAPNPAMMLAQLLAGMKDQSGRVLVPHFYDGVVPLSATEKRALASAPVNDPMLIKSFALGHTEGAGAHLLELINLPALNVTGISAGHTGEHATNTIPATAVASIDLRLVVGSDWRKQQERIVDYIRSRGYFVVDADPSNDTLLSHPYVAKVIRDQASYNAVRTPMDLPIAQEVISAVRSARGDVVALPTMGGSLPLESIERAANTRTIIVPIANYDDNQHAADENLRLQNLWDGIETMAALMEMN
jgi:acetylornithine deacetylase/succinyl-diaminopimelate desuccinylase-like protein